MSLRIDYEPALSDRDRDGAAYAAEDALYLCSGHPLECDCPECMPELYEEHDAAREERAA